MTEKKKVRTIFIVSIIILSSFLFINNRFIHFSQKEFQTQLPEGNSPLDASIYDWDSQITIGVGQNPLSIATGDVNNDGEIDIVVANYQSNTTSILLWNITLGVWVTQNRSVGNGPRSVAVGDANNDGFADIVTANRLSNDISILLWNSTSQNWTAQTLAVGDQPSSVAIGDATNNGTNEIVIANYNDNNVSIFTWNISNSTWNPEITRSVGSGPVTVKIGDLYEDGLNEIITGNEVSGNAIILRWNETAKDWYQAIPIVLGIPPSMLTLGDGNNDGQIELIKTSLLDNFIYFWAWNHGTQVWDQSTKTIGSNSSAITVGDVNSDGQNDIVTTNYWDSNINLLLWNNSANDWSVTTKSVGTGPAAVIIDDVNNDGLAEIVTANRLANTISILLWNTTSGMLGGSIWRSVSYRPAAVAAGDVNHDGEIDIVTANSNNNSVSIFTWNETLTDWNPEILLPVNVSPTALDIGDVNNDGVQDIVAYTSNVSLPFSRNVSILLWNKLVNDWDPYITRYVAPFSCDDVIIADVNNDGANDIAAVTEYSGPYLFVLLWNKSTGDWNPSRGLTVGAAPYDVEVGDVNNDGFNDIVVAGNRSGPIAAQYWIRLWNGSKGDWDNHSTYTFWFGAQFFTPAIAIGDANNDGLNDLVVTNKEMNRVNISIWNDTIDTWNPPIPKDVASDPVSVEIGDVNNDGQNDIVASCLSGHASVLEWNATNNDWEYHSDKGAGINPRSVVIEDVTDDGMNDITVVNPQANTISVVPYNRYPFILSKTQLQSNPVWVQDEDFGSFPIDLTGYESDPEDQNANLLWYPSDLNTSLVTVSGNFSANDVLTFYSIGNVSGTDTFWLRLQDGHNFQDMISITIIINAVNDAPVILSKNELRGNPIWAQSLDVQSFSIDLTTYESDVEDDGSNLDWFVSGLDPSIATITGENSSDDVLTFYPQGKGTDTFYLVLIDSEGGMDTILITITIGANIKLILAIVIPLVVAGAVVGFYLLYWRKRIPPKKLFKRVKIAKSHSQKA